MNTFEPGQHDPAPKLYVLVRRDLPWPVRMVQAIHAATNHARTTAYHWQQSGPSVVLCGLKDEAELASWQSRLDGVSTPFYEPDLNNQLTAIAFISSSLPELESLRLL